jgi:hypothetical protein
MSADVRFEHAVTRKQVNLVVIFRERMNYVRLVKAELIVILLRTVHNRHVACRALDDQDVGVVIGDTGPALDRVRKSHLSLFKKTDSRIKPKRTNSRFGNGTPSRKKMVSLFAANRWYGRRKIVVSTGATLHHDYRRKHCSTPFLKAKWFAGYRRQDKTRVDDCRTSLSDKRRRDAVFNYGHRRAANLTDFMCCMHIE